MREYTHLHLHTEYSLLDGTNKIKELAHRLKDIGVTSCAITDHGNMYGALEFYKTMRENGIKPIIGIETYLHNNDELDDHDAEKSSRHRFHLCLYAKNEVGYQNLMYLSSMAYLKGFYHKPRINKKILREHSEGLICSSACLAGEVAFNLNANKRNVARGAGGYEAAKKAAMEYKEIFGDDFYLEIMRHGIGDQARVDDDIIRLSKELGIKLIATNDAHYIDRSRAVAQKIFVYISAQENFRVSDSGKVLSEFYVKSREEMEEIFADIPEALDNTQEIVEKCNLEIKLGNPTPPNFKFTREQAAKLGVTLPNPDSEYDLENDACLFEYVCRSGLEERLKFIPEDKHEIYRERLDREINTIRGMKFPGYMLIVADFINYAKDHGIPVGPGRGSAAGSLVAYAMRITDLDPIPYNLLFERFLNPERVTMPDIDVDFCQDRRGEVIDYVIRKYGATNVAQVATFGKLLAKGVIKDVARVMEMDYSTADKFAKLIPEELGITLKAHKNKKGEMEDGAYEKEPKIAEFLAQNDLAQHVWDYACELEGLNRQPGMHAAGIVISNEPLWKKTPLWRQSDAEEGHYVTQYSKDYLEDVDLIKFDFLGLKTLTVISKALELVKKRFGREIVWEQIDFNDPKTYETIQSGNTVGIFQIESGGMQNLAAKLRPDCFEDIIAMIALYRPGPLNSGMVDDFVDIKHGRKELSFAFDVLKPILEPTYGVMVYQEQVMQVVQAVGGFSLGGADLVRRAMSKKKEAELLKMKNQYLEGARSKGLDEKKAADLFELIMKFAEYGFNKSHSAAYGLIVFQTAYLKTYYPAEFMAALITSEANKTDKVAKYIDEVRRLNIDLLPPSINESMEEFSVIQKDGKDAIVFGFSAIKGVGGKAIKNILEARESGGAFSNLNDFISRTDGNVMDKGVYESLIKSGAFDVFGHTRKMLVVNLENIAGIIRNLNDIKRNSVGSLFGEDDEDMNSVSLELREVPLEYDKRELLPFEKATLGIYVSGHPLDDYREQIAGIAHTDSADFEGVEDGAEILVVGKIEDESSKITKSGMKMAILNVLDFGGNMEITAFNEYKKIEAMKGENPVSALEPLAFKCAFGKDGQQYRLKLNAVLTLAEAAQGVKLKSTRLNAEEIALNATLLNRSERSKISALAFAPSPTLVVAKINDFEQKTAKSGSTYYTLTLIDDSGSGDFVAFEDSGELIEAHAGEVLGFKVTPAAEGKNRHTVNQVILASEVAEGKFNLKARRGYAKKGGNSNLNSDFGGGFSNGDFGEMKSNAPTPITGELCVELDLGALNHELIAQLYALAHSQNGDKKLVLRVQNSLKNETMIYDTNIGVFDTFKEHVAALVE